MIASSALVVLVSLVLPRADITTGHLPADPPELATFNAERPIAGDVLAQSHGQSGLDPTAIVSRRMVDERSRADFQTFGMISRTQMEVWWGTTGASLIAASVRSAGPPT